MRAPTTIGFLTLVVALTVLGAGQELSAASAERDLAIGKLSADGKRVELRTARLQKKLLDGSQVRGFRVLRRGEQYSLLRFGRTAEGRRVTESIGLALGDGRLNLGELKWITVCAQSECEGFCMPDGDHCDCSGMDPDDGDPNEVLVLDGAGAFDVEEPYASGSHNPGASRGCTFGSQPGSYDVVILH